jgi:hypothetical protein
VVNTIQTNKLSTTVKNSYTYLAQSTTPNTPEYLPGDGPLVVPDFDSYVMFDFSQMQPDNSLIETDLSGAGQIYLTFIDDQRQIKIPALQDLINVDKTVGQAVFKISADQSSSIFQLSNRYYFVTTAVSVGSAVVNETVLYSGVWIKSNEPERVTYSERLKILNDTLKDSDLQIKTLQTIVDALKLRKNNLTERSNQLSDIITDLRNQIGSSSEEIANIEAKIDKEKDTALVAQAEASATADATKMAQEEQDSKKSKRRKARILQTTTGSTFKKKLRGLFKNPIKLIGAIINPIAAVAYLSINKGLKVNYELELEDTKEKVKVKRFAYIYSDTSSVNNSGGDNTFINDSWFSIKDSEGGRPSAGKVTVIALIDKRLDQFDSKDQFKMMVGTDPVVEPAAAYNESNKSAAAFYLGSPDNYYYKYVTFARDVDPQKKITEIIGEVEL